MAGALSGIDTANSRRCEFPRIVPGAAGMSAPPRLAPTEARRVVLTGTDGSPGVSGPPILSVSAWPITCGGQFWLGPGVPR